MFYFLCVGKLFNCKKYISSQLNFSYMETSWSSLASLYLGYILSWEHRTIFDSKPCISTTLIKFLQHQTLFLIRGIIYSVLGWHISSSSSAGVLEQIQSFSQVLEHALASLFLSCNFACRWGLFPPFWMQEWKDFSPMQTNRKTSFRVICVNITTPFASVLTYNQIILFYLTLMWWLKQLSICFLK